MKCEKTSDELIVLDWDGVTIGEPTGMSIREIKEE